MPDVGALLHYVIIYMFLYSIDLVYVALYFKYFLDAFWVTATMLGFTHDLFHNQK